MQRTSLYWANNRTVQEAVDQLNELAELIGQLEVEIRVENDRNPMVNISRLMVLLGRINQTLIE